MTQHHTASARARRVKCDCPTVFGGMLHLYCNVERLCNCEGATMLRCNQLQAARCTETR